MRGPAREQRLENARERALPHRDAAGHADDVRRRRRQAAEKRVGGFVQVLGRGDVQVQKSRDRQIDRFDLGQ